MRRIKPNGWIRNFLNTQMHGLTGNIRACGFPFDEVSWGKPDVETDCENPSWWVYEQTAYAFDGLTRTAILLDDKNKLEEVKRTIYYVLNNADKDGYLGPKFLKDNSRCIETIDARWNRWPHVVFFRALIAYYDFSKDDNIIKAITRHYLESEYDYSYGREVLNAEIMLLVYGITRNEGLLRLALKTYKDYNERCSENDPLRDDFALSDKKPYIHGVSYNEFSKLGALLYLYTGEKRFLDSSVNAFNKINKYFILPNGCCCSDEFMIDNDYMQMSETCNVSDYTWALNYLLRATLDPVYSDKIEKCVFNAGIGAVTEDFRALQYLSCANQVIADDCSAHVFFHKGDPLMAYKPNPFTACCAGNVNRFMPNYVLNAYYSFDDKVYSTLFVDSEFETQINGKTVKITQITNYPFEEKVVYKIETQTEFSFFVRIPLWAKSYSLKLNGKPVVINKNVFNELIINANSVIELSFESKIEKVRTADGVYFVKGALVYSFGMFGKREKDVTKSVLKDFPSYAIYADKEWRYALTDCMPTFLPCEKADGFDLRKPLPVIKVKAKRLKCWDYVRKTRIHSCYNLYTKKYKVKTGNFVFTPRLPNENNRDTVGREVDLELKPYGACKLRITVFAELKRKL